MDTEGVTGVTGKVAQVHDPSPAIRSIVATVSAVTWIGLSIGLNGLMIAGTEGAGLLTLGVEGLFGVVGETPGSVGVIPG